jgi:hypothetical protein
MAACLGDQRPGNVVALKVSSTGFDGDSVLTPRRVAARFHHALIVGPFPVDPKVSSAEVEPGVFDRRPVCPGFGVVNTVPNGSNTRYDWRLPRS